MLRLQDILWVIPGVIFIYCYNKRRPHEAINLSGWPYLFFLAVIASITWLPAAGVFKLLESNLPPGLIAIKRGIILLLSVVLAMGWFLLIQWEWILEKIKVAVQDNFYKKCIDWANKEILLTLKNNKAYHCLLWKYPENPKSRHESQTISIIPFKSGYRNKETKKVTWNTYYPEYKNYNHFVDMEVIIPRSEIITFGKFNSSVFKHFYKNTV